jgi:heme/copper-type cytochrome/quinol oxidase subunit 1
MGENNEGDGRQPPRRGQVRAAVVPFVGVVIMVVGCFVAWSNRNSYMGWFAYAPLSNEVFSGNGVAFISQGTQIGLGIMVAGLLVVAFGAGYRMGRRGSTRP